MEEDLRNGALRQELDSAQLIHLRPILSALAVIYIAFAAVTAASPGITDPEARAIMVALNLGAAAVMASSRVWLSNNKLPTTYASTALATTMSLIILTSTVRLYLTLDPMISAIPVITVFLSGTVILSRKALLVVTLIGITSWLFAFSSSSWSQMWLRSAVGMTSGFFFAFFIQRLRLRHFTRDFFTRKKLTSALARTRDAALAERRSRKAAERASFTKSQFLAHISHEIRTPLNAVIGMTSLLLKSDLDADQQDYTEIVRDAGEGMLTLVNDLLDLAKIEADRIVFENIPFDLQKTLQSVVALLADAARKKHLEVTVELAKALPIHLMGDPERTRQILINLLSNAIKFTPQGAINIRVNLQSTGETPPMMRFEVRDSGVGIPQEQQAQLFESYVQANASITRTYGGTGLGLAIVSQLVSRMGGHIGIDSEVGVGSTFWFTLPFKRVDPGSQQDPSTSTDTDGWAPPPADGATILIVDDNPINLRLLRVLLERLGYQVVAVTGGQEAIKSARNLDIQAIIMDIQMPLIDGFEATRAIREAEIASGHGRQVPILACTANAQSHERERCIRAGMDGYLSKPLRSEALARELNRLLQASA